MISHQLPGYSPLELREILRAGVRSASHSKAVLNELRAYLTERFRADDAVLTGSGTHALQLAFGLAETDRPVALPAYSCFDLATAVVGAGVHCCFYDIDPVSLTPDIESLEGVLGAGAGTVVVGNLFGFPVDWEEVRRTTGRYDVLLIEDAAQAIGSAWGRHEGGSFGDVTILSFGRGKGWTGGGGGALLLRSEHAELGELVATAGLPDWIRTTAQWALGRPNLYGIPKAIPGLALGSTMYKEPTEISGMSPFAAASVYAHRLQVREEEEARQRAAGAWVRSLSERDKAGGMPVQRCQPVDGGVSAYLRFPVVARDTGWTARFVRKTERFGVARGYPRPLCTLSVMKQHLVRSSSTCPGAERLAGKLLTLPVHSRVRPKDKAHILRELDAASSTL